MIGECVDDEREFGIVCMSDDGLAEVGCTASVTRVIERFEDGRMNILVVGGRPFRLLRRIDDMPYPAGDVEPLEDLEEEASAEAAGAARERYADLVERATDTRPSEDDLTELDAYGMAATLDFSLSAKQELLELRSERERLDRIADLFTDAMRQIDHAERAADAAQGNGKVRFPRV
jgi:Lon protease-like protein